MVKNETLDMTYVVVGGKRAAICEEFAIFIFYDGTWIQFGSQYKPSKMLYVICIRVQCRRSGFPLI